MSHQQPFTESVRQAAERIAESGVPALSGLYDLTAPRLVRLATAITRNQHDAEDVVQGVLVRIALDPELLIGAVEPWAYLLRMVRNEALVVLRRRRPLLSLTPLMDLFTQRRVDQEEQEDTYRAVWLALRRLPTEQSEVVVLKIWEEMTFLQIAEVLEVAPATVASRYRYALAKLARRLGSIVREEQDA